MGNVKIQIQLKNEGDVVY